MFRNRSLPEVEAFRLPQPASQPITVEGFVFCPPVAVPGLTVELWLWQQLLYQRALAEAQAVVRPSILERDLVAFQN